MSRAHRFRFSQVLALVLRMEREQQALPVRDVAAALQLTESGYSRIETGDTELTVQHLWLISKVLKRQPRGFWRIAETWASALETLKWTEDKHAGRLPTAEMLNALLQALPGTGEQRGVSGEETGEGKEAKKPGDHGSA